MTAAAHREARALLILSKDFGELGFALSLLRGQAFASRARMLLPDRLFSVNRNALPVPAASYATLDDILGVVEAHQPQLVFMLSAYEFSGNKVLSADAVQALLARLRERGCRLITSDPWLGLAPRLTLAEIDVGAAASGVRAWHRWLLVLMSRLLNGRRLVHRVPGLEDVVHLYPTSVPPSDDDIPRLSYFNPAIIRGSTGRAAVGDGRVRDQGHSGRRRWLFVISVLDLNIQLRLMGLRGFTEFLIGLVRRALEADRDPVLVAPSVLEERLARALPASVELLPFCPYAEFEERLLDAEYVFYWNAFSFSQLTRAANELPIFVFDRGHASRIIKPYYDLARSCHFGGWEPTFLDPTRVFSPEVLAHLAQGQKPGLRAVRERWQASPTPDNLVGQLLDPMPQAATDHRSDDG